MVEIKLLKLSVDQVLGYNIRRKFGNLPKMGGFVPLYKVKVLIETWFNTENSIPFFIGSIYCLSFNSFSLASGVSEEQMVYS